MKQLRHSPILPSVALSALIVLGTVTLPSEGLQAQTTKPAPKPGQGTQQPWQGRGGNRGARGGDRLERMGKELNLTQAQKNKIKPILEQSRQRSEKLRSDQSLSREKRREQMQKEHQETNKKIDAILTPEQRKKNAELQKQREQRMQQRRQQGGQGQGAGRGRGPNQGRGRGAGARQQNA